MRVVRCHFLFHPNSFKISVSGIEFPGNVGALIEISKARKFVHVVWLVLVGSHIMEKEDHLLAHLKFKFWENIFFSLIFLGEKVGRATDRTNPQPENFWVIMKFFLALYFSPAKIYILYFGFPNTKWVFWMDFAGLDAGSKMPRFSTLKPGRIL